MPRTRDEVPDGLTEEEAALFRQGRCSRVTESGNGGSSKYCGQPSAAGAMDGDCEDHEGEDY